MGNYRFRLSHMMPNAWFYKLKDMSRTRSQNSFQSIKKKLPSPTTTTQKTNLSQPRYSYYYNTKPIGTDMLYGSPVNPKVSDTHFPDPPRKSSTRRAKRKTIYKPSSTLVSSSASVSCSCPATLDSVWTEHDPTGSGDYFVSAIEPSQNVSFLPEFEPDMVDASDSLNGLTSWSTSCRCRVSSSTTNIFIDVNNKSFSSKVDKLDEFDTVSEIELPPISTKPARFRETTMESARYRSSSKLEEIKAQGSLSIKIVKEGSTRTQKETKVSALIRKPIANSAAGVKLRANSPRLTSRKLQAYARKSVSSGTSSKPRNRTLSESCAVVKASLDPQKDFRDSMVEMIVENNIRASKDLEELLACYLSLNSDEYHDLIVQAFQQIWFDMSDLRR